MASLLGLATSTGTPTLSFRPPPLTIKLDRENYSLWRSTVISALEAYELEAHVLAPHPPSETRLVSTEGGVTTTEVNPAYIDWRKRDRIVLLWLKSTLTDRALALVARASTSHLAWQCIETSFQSQTRARRIQLKAQLQTLSKGALSMYDYIEKKRAIADSLADTLQPISDEDLIGHILTGLDSSYSAFATSFMMKVDSMTVDDLIGLLLQEESRLEHDRTRLGALLPTPPPPQAAAYNIHRPPSRSYPARFTSRPAARSFSPRARPSDSHSGSSDFSARSGDSHTRPQCQLCRGLGHEAIDCWQRSNQLDFPSRRPLPRSRTSSHSRQQPRQAYVAHHTDSSTVVDPAWYFDTGATDHVTPDLGKLTVADDYAGEDKLQVGNGSNSTTGRYQ
ncbi:Retrovirus-related Pol polyprotein from transposon RE1 [Linum perenne]